MSNETEKAILQRMVDLLDVQAERCRKAGATISYYTLDKPVGGNVTQNSYYYGNLNMAQAIAWELSMDIYKRNGHHVLVHQIKRTQSDAS